MKLIVGLGNPGRSYSQHRHNIGFRVIDLLAQRHGIELRKRLFQAMTGSGSIAGESVLLAEPETFMNLSGESVIPLLHFYKVELDSLIVIHDDLDIECGKLKLAARGGHGGHNGIRSLLDAAGADGFLRVRIGIGRPPVGMDPANYVLSRFPEEDRENIDNLVARAADAVEALLRDGLAKAQQQYH